MTDPTPLTDDELAQWKPTLEHAFPIGQPPSGILRRLVATVEQARGERDAAHAVIRRLHEGWEFLPTVDEWPDTWSHHDPVLGDEPATPAEVDAIRQARATTGQASP